MLDKIYIKSEDIVVKQLSGEIVIVPLSNDIVKMSEIFTLNEVGAFIFTLFDGKKNVSSIIKNVLAEFDVDNNTAQNDVVEFVELALKKNIIKEIETSTY
ncbi:MAG: PqqD family protein [Marinilabiliaceae bacterium]|nr:PqqD family protein [Marinilabiliaceae bacterium]